MLSRLLNTAAVSALAVSTAFSSIPFATSVSFSYAQQTQAPDMAEPSGELKKLDKDARNALKKAQKAAREAESSLENQEQAEQEQRQTVKEAEKAAKQA